MTAFSKEQIRTGFILKAAAYAVVLFTFGNTLALGWNRYSDRPLSDSSSYPALARYSSLFYDSGDREPVPVFLAKVFLSLGFKDELSVRLSTLFITLLGGACYLFFSSRRFGFTAGITASFFMALNPLIGYYSVQGVNNQTAGIFLILFFFSLSAGQDSFPGRAVTVLLGALTVLSRLEMLLVVFLILLLDAFFSFSPARTGRNAFLFLSVFLLASPYLVYQKRRFGHPLYTHRLHARFWQNTRLGVPPEGNRYRGGELGLKEFIVRKKLTEAPVDMLKGYIKAFSHYLPRIFGSTALLIFFWAGFLRSLFAERIYYCAVFLSILFPISFILPLDQAYRNSGVELRFLLPALWFSFLFAGLGAEWLFSFCRTAFKKRTA
ncbi:MAG TPA: glycosyltransferase family 39 protein [bacterium]|nr:glycosyltransferase family 39 protein [bacterium]